MLNIVKKLMWPLRLFRIDAGDLNVVKIGGMPAILLATVGLIDPTSTTILNQIINPLKIELFFGTMAKPQFLKITPLERGYKGLFI
jgi:hypothetical protein